MFNAPKKSMKEKTNKPIQERQMSKNPKHNLTNVLKCVSNPKHPLKKKIKKKKQTPTAHFSI